MLYSKGIGDYTALVHEMITEPKPLIVAICHIGRDEAVYVCDRREQFTLIEADDESMKLVFTDGREWVIENDNVACVRDGSDAREGMEALVATGYVGYVFIFYGVVQDWCHE